MRENSNWFPMPRIEILFLIGAVLYMIICFFPGFNQLIILNIPIVAWGGFFLFFLSPIVGLIIALRDKDYNHTLNEYKKEEEK